MEAGPRRSGDGGFGTPAELGAVAPEAVQEHGELAGDRNLGLLEAAALGDAKAPPAQGQIRLILTSSTFAAS